METNQYQLTHPTLPPTTTPDSKVLSDLDTVKEKIALCASMLVNLSHTSQVDQDESLLAIIGFLEACVPRVRELVEVGMQGALLDDTTMKCLEVNDSLYKVLEDVEHPESVTSQSLDKNSSHPPAAAFTATAGVASVAAAAVDTSDPLGFDAFGFNDQKQGINNIGKSEEGGSSDTAAKALEELLAAPTSTTTSTSAAATSTNTNNDKNKDGDDEFDDFFGERVGGGSFSIDD